MSFLPLNMFWGPFGGQTTMWYQKLFFLPFCLCRGPFGSSVKNALFSILPICGSIWWPNKRVPLGAKVTLFRILPLCGTISWPNVQIGVKIALFNILPTWGTIWWYSKKRCKMALLSILPISRSIWWPSTSVGAEVFSSSSLYGDHLMPWEW